MPKSKEFVSTSDSDSDSEPKQKKKKTKHATPEKKESEKKGAAKASTSASGETMFQLSRMRFVSVSEFRGKKMVNIREYYESDGELKPGRKGIALNMEQWEKLKSTIDDIDEALDNL